MFRRGRGGGDDSPGSSDAAPDDGVDRYKIREKMISLGDDYWIETTRGRRAFKVNGKAMRLRDTLTIEDPNGRELCKIQEKMLRVRDTMTIEREGVGEITVKKALLTPLRERFVAEMPGGGEIQIQGNLLDHNYNMESGGQKVAEVSKKWVALRDTYTVEVAPGQDDVSILAIAVVIDQMTHDVG